MIHPAGPRPLRRQVAVPIPVASGTLRGSIPGRRFTAPGYSAPGNPGEQRGCSSRPLQTGVVPPARSPAPLEAPGKRGRGCARRQRPGVRGRQGDTKHKPGPPPTLQPPHPREKPGTGGTGQDAPCPPALTLQTPRGAAVPARCRTETPGARGTPRAQNGYRGCVRDRPHPRAHGECPSGAHVCPPSAIPMGARNFPPAPVPAIPGAPRQDGPGPAHLLVCGCSRRRAVPGAAAPRSRPWRGLTAATALGMGPGRLRAAPDRGGPAPCSRPARH